MNTVPLTRSPVSLMPLALFTMTIFMGAAAVAEGEDIGSKQKCVSLSFIDQTPIIDERTILVEMRSGRGYKRIDIAGRCPGIIYNGFSRRSRTSNELCDSDTLVVRGPVEAVCMIDKIVTIDEAEAKSLLAKR